MTWILEFVKLIFDNFRLWVPIAAFIFLIGFVPSLKRAWLAFKQGLKDMATPSGFFIMLGLAAIFIYLMKQVGII